MRPATETAANAGASHTELRSHAPDRTRRRERGSAGRRRGWTVLKIVAMLIIGGLVVDKVLTILHPPPQVGRWKSVEAKAAYASAYDQAMGALPDPTRTLDVQTDFGSVRVLEWEGSEPGPPVVLLPGRSSGAPMWIENLPDWIGERTVYAMDPLGDAGFSAQTVPLTSFDAQAEWIDQALDGLAVDRAHIVGHSFGGASAAVFAVHHPAKVATLTLLEPVMVIEAMPASAFFWATILVLPVPQSMKDRALAEIGGTTVEEVQERTPLSVMIDAASQGYAAALPQPRRLTDDEWASLDMPMRVEIAGTKSLAGGQDAVDRIGEQCPQAVATLWPDATHSLPMQEREVLGPALADFWRSHS